MVFDTSFKIKGRSDVELLVEKYGFLPFFANSIAGFSIEEMIEPSLWFTDKDGPWEWKGPLIRENGFYYGKLFEKKAAYVSKKWYPVLACMRRDGYDLDARYDDGLASANDLDLFTLIDKNAPVTSVKLKETGNYGKTGRKGFETMITRLQMQCYVNVADFVYLTDRHGKEYGWGVGVYTTPERFGKAGFKNKVYSFSPEECREKLIGHFSSLFPGTDSEVISRFLK